MEGKYGGAIRGILPRLSTISHGLQHFLAGGNKCNTSESTGWNSWLNTTQQRRLQASPCWARTPEEIKTVKFITAIWWNDNDTLYIKVPRSLGPRSLGPRSLDPRSLGPRSLGLRSLGPRSLGQSLALPCPNGPLLAQQFRKHWLVYRIQVYFYICSVVCCVYSSDKWTNRNTAASLWKRLC